MVFRGLFGGSSRNLGALVAEVGLDTDRLRRDSATAQSQFQAIGRSITNIAAVAGVGLGAAGVVGAIGSTIRAASDLNESVNAVNVVFEDAASTILEFGKNASRTAGLSAAQFNQLSVTTGSLLQNFGLSAEDAAQQTTRLAQRAADMASVFNTDVQDALFAINAALRGETEPIRRYAADITEASLQTFALSQGIDQSVASMSQQEKGLLRLEAVLAQTNKTEGDFVNTSDDLANLTRTLQSEFSDLKAELGQELIPAATGATSGMLGLVRAFSDLKDLDIRTVTGDVVTFGDAVEGALRFTFSSGAFGREVQDAIDNQRRLNELIAQGDLPQGATVQQAVELANQRREALAGQGQVIRELAERTEAAAASLTRWNEQQEESFKSVGDANRAFNQQALAADSLGIPLVQTSNILHDLSTAEGRVAAAASDVTERMREQTRVMSDAGQTIRDIVFEDVAAVTERLRSDNFFEFLNDTTRAILAAIPPMEELRRETGTYQNLIAFGLDQQAQDFADGILAQEDAFNQLTLAVTAANVQLGRFEGFQSNVFTDPFADPFAENRFAGSLRRRGGGSGLPPGVTPVTQDEIEARREAGETTAQAAGGAARVSERVVFTDPNGQFKQQARIVSERFH